MRLHFGPVPLSADFDPDGEGWTKLREPTPGWMQVIATPIAIAMAALLILAWTHLTPVASSRFRVASGSGQDSFFDGAAVALATVVLGLATLIAVHELLHAVTFPGWGLTRETLIGVWPARLLFYAAYLGPLSKPRFLWVFAMPFLILSLVPLVVCAAFQTASAAVAILSIVNGACACGDLLGIGLIGWQVPRRALVRNQGWQTWWKVPQ